MVTAAQLHEDLRHLWRQYWNGNYPQLARDLPERITAARVAVTASPGDRQPIAYTVLAELLQITGTRRDASVRCRRRRRGVRR